MINFIGLDEANQAWLELPGNRAMLRRADFRSASALSDAEYGHLEGGRCPDCLAVLGSFVRLATPVAVVRLCASCVRGWYWSHDERPPKMALLG